MYRNSSNNAGENPHIAVVRDGRNSGRLASRLPARFEELLQFLGRNEPGPSPAQDIDPAWNPRIDPIWSEPDPLWTVGAPWDPSTDFENARIETPKRHVRPPKPPRATDGPTLLRPTTFGSIFGKNPGLVYDRGALYVYEDRPWFYDSDSSSAGSIETIPQKVEPPKTELRTGGVELACYGPRGASKGQ